MTIRLAADETIELVGVCPIEDAEKLLQYLTGNPQAAIDWRSCTAAHTSVVQILLAANPILHGPPESDFLRSFIAPMIRRMET